MKYRKQNKDGSVTHLEGTPEELVAYHRQITSKSNVARSRKTQQQELAFTPSSLPKKLKPKRKPRNGQKFCRAKWTPAADAYIKSLANVGKSNKQIAKAINKTNLRPIVTTPQAVYVRLHRLG